MLFVFHHYEYESILKLAHKNTEIFVSERQTWKPSCSRSRFKTTWTVDVVIRLFSSQSLSDSVAVLQIKAEANKSQT